MSSAESNFKRRFGENPRISIIQIKETPADCKERNERIFKAYCKVLQSLINREPSSVELFGLPPAINIKRNSELRMRRDQLNV